MGSMSLEQRKEILCNGSSTGKYISSYERVKSVNNEIVVTTSNTAGYLSLAIASVYREGK